MDWDSISAPVQSAKPTAADPWDAVSKPAADLNTGAQFPPKGDDLRFREADAPGILGKIAQSVRGKQDPRYKDVGAYTGSHAARYGAGLVTHDDQAYGDIVTKSLGNRLVRRFRDANDYELIDYKGEGADADKTYRAYINKPGLDRFDVSRGLMSAIPFVASAGGAGLATQGAGLAARATAQGAAAAGTSVAQDIAAKPMGSEQGIDSMRALAFGGLGAGGEVAAAAIKPLVDRWRASGMVKNGVLTPEGEAAARAQGLDPTKLRGYLAEEFQKTYAMTGDASQAAMRVSKGEFDIPSTVGQRTGKKDLLDLEERMRRNLRGEPAQNAMLKFDQQQAQAIDNAALGGIRPTGQPNSAEMYGIAPTLAPQRPLRMGKAEMGELVGDSLKAAKDTAKAAERDAWQKPIDMMATKEALDTLPGIIDGRLGAMTVDGQLMPASGHMVDQLKRYISGDLEKISTGAFGTNPRMATVDEMRKRLGQMVGNASTDADRAAAKQIYHGFNDWIEEAAQKSLLAGDAQAAANLRKAIDVTREYRSLFNPRDTNGMTAPAARIIKDIMTSESTPERIVTRLFGGNPLKTQAPPAGTVEALQSMKQIFAKYGPNVKTNADPWNDVRLAYWTRLVQDGKGEMLTPQNLVNNIRGAFANQQSVLRTLYTSEEQAMMRRFAAEVQKAAYKPPNASGTSYGVEGTLQTAAKTLAKGLSTISGGLADKIIMALIRPVANEFGRAAATKATAQEIGRRVPFGAARYGAAAAAVAD